MNFSVKMQQIRGARNSSGQKGPQEVAQPSPKLEAGSALKAAWVTRTTPALGACCPLLPQQRQRALWKGHRPSSLVLTRGLPVLGVSYSWKRHRFPRTTGVHLPRLSNSFPATETFTAPPAPTDLKSAAFQPPLASPEHVREMG